MTGCVPDDDEDMGRPVRARTETASGSGVLVTADQGRPWWAVDELVHALLHSLRCEDVIRAALGYEPVVRLTGDTITLGYLVQARMGALRLLGRFAESLEVSEELLAIHRGAGAVVDEAKTLAERVECMAMLGRFDDAMRSLARSSILLTTADRADPRFGPAMSCLARAAADAELYEAADAAYLAVADRDLITYDSMSRVINHSNHADLLLEWAMRLDQIGRDEQANELYLRCLDVVEQCTSAHDRCWPRSARSFGLATRALALANLGRHHEALEVALTLRPFLRPAEMAAEATLTELTIAVVLGARGDVAGARSALASAGAYSRSDRSGVRAMVQHVQTSAFLGDHSDAAGGWARATAESVIRAQAARLWELRQQRLDALQQAEAREHGEAARRLAEQAMLYDQLTGLGNRRRLEVEQRRSRPAGAGCTMLMIDVDHFKHVNDRFSHRVGDEVLQTLAEIISSQCRPADVAVRFGGDEFVVLLDGARDVGLLAGKRIRDLVRGWDWEHLAPGLHVTVSIGVADTADCDDWVELFDAADAQLFDAKKSGRDAVAGQ